jgi:hypothetical protein
MMSSASDGATATFATGAYSWTETINFSMSKGITLICASAGGCNVTGSNLLGMNGTCSGTSTKLYRVSGFAFSGNSTRFWFYGSSPCLLTQLRIDHNSFSVSGEATLMYFGENSSSNNYFHGVIDHNTVSASQSIYFAQLVNSNSDNAPSGALGTANNLFFENNTITVTTMTNSGTGCMDMWGGHAVVWRYNTCTNARILSHGVQHGWGPTNFEVYGNAVNHTSGSALGNGYRSIHHQGSGMFMVFNNTVTPSSGNDNNAIALLHYRSWTTGVGGIARCTGSMGVDGNRIPTSTYFGYPCKRQPGRDIDGSLSPVYVWNNRWTNNGQLISLACNDQGETNPNTCVNHLVANRDIYNGVSINAQTSPLSPFNGSTGMGFGTLANRPASCTTNSLEPGGGVGYFATDDGAQGTLYRCSATNSWTVHYTPYTYPHPLQAGGSGGGDATPPAAPINLRIQ